MGMDIRDIDELAAKQVQEAKTRGITLDFTPETFPLLDHDLRLQAEGLAAGATELLWCMTGAYFGAVVAQAWPGLHWRLPDVRPESWRLCCPHTALSFNPIGIAAEVQQQAEVAGWGAHVQVRDRDKGAAAEALALYGAARRDDYFTFAMRYEGIELLLHRLGSMHAPE
ncbi:MAG: hypothetical protein ACPGUV_05885 [Polyangiales bacterium]